ncbi:MAG: hypothetical protein KGJ59_14700, partial [Bacteroidota bacterium]|nr:hypothetical protein [Bacteroidota bacterium]
MLKINGKDVNDFLQRISTNDFSSFPENEIRPTLLLTEKGRVIDLIYVLRQDENVLVLTSGGAEEKVKQWLKRFIVMDDVGVDHVVFPPEIFLAFADEIAVNNIPQHRVSAFGLSFSVFAVYSNADKFISEMELHHAVMVSNHAWETFRIMNGIPEFG